MASSSKELELAIKIAGKVESSFTGALSVAGKEITGLTKIMTAATTAAAAAVGAIAVAAVNVGKEFESAMSQVQATMLLDTSTEEGAAAYATLEEAARECGRTTAFSATEAAEALNYLALAGYNAEEAATALPTVLRLAGAGAMDLAAASDMVTDSMSALQIEATEANLNSFADQMAQTASKANTSVAQLGEAILTVGATGANLAGGTTELNTALGILADNGLKGAEGGTHLRNVILSLQNPTDKAAEALSNMGISVYDAQGNMRGLNDIFGDLNTAMASMTQAEKDNIISTIFNKTDLTSANALLANCTDRWDELSVAIENSAGACEDMYAIQLDNLDGDIKILQSGLSDLGISIYQDLNGSLRSMTQLATSMVEELSAAYSEGGLEGMVGAIGGCLSQTVDVIAGYVPQVVSMGVNLISSFVQGIADNAGALADVGAQALTVFIDGLFSLVPQVLLAGIDIVVQLTASITDQLPALINNGTLAIVNFVNGITQRLPLIISTALTLVQTLVSGIGANAPMLISAAVQLIGNLVIGLVSMLPQLLQMGIQLILSLVQGILSNLPLILQMGVQIIVSLVNGLVSMLPMIIQGGIQLIVSLLQGIVQNLPAILQAAVQIVMVLIAGLISAIPQLVAAIPQLIAAIIDTIFSTDWIQVGADMIAGIADGFISGFTSLVDSVKGLWSDFTGWLFSDGSEDSATASGETVASSYANGIASNSDAASAATTSMIASSFSMVDYTAATTAGTAGAEAYMTGLTDGLTDYTFNMSELAIDTTEITTSFTAAGTAGGEALSAGIAESSSTVAAAATDLAGGINMELDVGWNTAQNSAESALSRLVSTVQAKAQEAAQAVKSAFENMTITIPRPKLPVISVSTNSVSYGDNGSVNVPSFSVSWNALGGIFGKPTILSTADNGLQGVGEAGAEAVLPLDTLWSKMKSILSDAIKQSSGGGIIEALLQRLQGIGSGGGGGGFGPELAGAGGPNITYAPVYHLHGSATKEDAVQAEKMSQAEFNKMIKQWQKDKDRTKF